MDSYTFPLLGWKNFRVFRLFEITSCPVTRNDRGVGNRSRRSSERNPRKTDLKTLFYIQGFTFWGNRRIHRGTDRVRTHKGDFCRKRDPTRLSSTTDKGTYFTIQGFWQDILHGYTVRSFPKTKETCSEFTNDSFSLRSGLVELF